MTADGGRSRIIDCGLGIRCAGDVIWMASYCPQWFVAMGKGPTLPLLQGRQPRSSATLNMAKLDITWDIAASTASWKSGRISDAEPLAVTASCSPRPTCRHASLHEGCAPPLDSRFAKIRSATCSPGEDGNRRCRPSGPGRTPMPFRSPVATTAPSACSAAWRQFRAWSCWIFPRRSINCSCSPARAHAVRPGLPRQSAAERFTGSDAAAISRMRVGQHWSSSAASRLYRQAGRRTLGLGPLFRVRGAAHRTGSVLERRRPHRCGELPSPHRPPSRVELEGEGGHAARPHARPRDAMCAAAKLCWRSKRPRRPVVAKTLSPPSAFAVSIRRDQQHPEPGHARDRCARRRPCCT